MWGAAIIAGISSILWFSVCCVVLGNIVSCIYKSLERSEVDEKKKGLSLILIIIHMRKVALTKFLLKHRRAVIMLLLSKIRVE